MPSTKPSRETTLAFYRKHARDFVKATARLDLHDLYEPFLKRLKPGAHILDAGCGSGRDGAAFVARGFRVIAIDASRAMVTGARQRRLDARLMTLQKIHFSAKFDGIWACASVLHVPHCEIPNVLGRFADVLKPGGLLYISLKESHGERVAEDGRFFSYFRKEEFTSLLTQRGRFELLDTWLTRAADSPGTDWPWLNFLATRQI